MDQALNIGMLTRWTVGLVLCMSTLFVPCEDSCAQTKRAEAEGEAAIVNNDIPSARLQAIASDKWAAIEQVVGVRVEAQTFVHT